MMLSVSLAAQDAQPCSVDYHCPGVQGVSTPYGSAPSLPPSSGSECYASCAECQKARFQMVEEMRKAEKQAADVCRQMGTSCSSHCTLGSCRSASCTPGAGAGKSRKEDALSSLRREIEKETAQREREAKLRLEQSRQEALSGLGRSAAGTKELSKSTANLRARMHSLDDVPDEEESHPARPVDGPHVGNGVMQRGALNDQNTIEQNRGIAIMQVPLPILDKNAKNTGGISGNLKGLFYLPLLPNPLDPFGVIQTAMKGIGKLGELVKWDTLKATGERGAETTAPVVSENADGKITLTTEAGGIKSEQSLAIGRDKDGNISSIAETKTTANNIGVTQTTDLISGKTESSLGAGGKVISNGPIPVTISCETKEDKDTPQCKGSAVKSFKFGDSKLESKVDSAGNLSVKAEQSAEFLKTGKVTMSGEAKKGEFNAKGSMELTAPGRMGSVKLDVEAQGKSTEGFLGDFVGRVIKKETMPE